jgi:hypothetical protein
MKLLAELERCISCGVPMTEAAMHAGADPAKPYCRGCARPDGSMISYDEVLGMLTSHLVRSLDLDESAARAIAAERLSKLPAWRRKPLRPGGRQ